MGEASQNRKVIEVPTQCGWQADGSFVYNYRVFTPDGRETTIPMPGLENINRSTNSAGTLEGWREVWDVFKAREMHTLLAVALDSFGAPLMKFTEYEHGDDFEWLIRKQGCMHCDDPGCLKACPSPGAIVQYTNGIVDFVSENCIGCGYCVKGCPFNIPRISKTDAKAYKCTLCSDRVVVGQAPACAKACPTQAIVFGTKADMIAHANKRITDLKSRGFNNAGLYDPPGVGGTHVMYVLHHNDKPSLYSGLPDNPRISPLIGVWKGVMKPLSLAAIAFAGVFGLMHYVTKGPNRVSEHDEEEATRLEKTKGA